MSRARRTGSRSSERVGIGLGLVVGIVRMDGVLSSRRRNIDSVYRIPELVLQFRLIRAGSQLRLQGAGSFRGA